MRTQVHGMWHAVVSQEVSWDGQPSVPQKVIYLLRPDAPPEPFLPFLKFVRDYGRATEEDSYAWQHEAAYAVGALIDYLVATKGQWDDKHRQDAFAAFARALVAGTFDTQGRDPTFLAWEDRSVGRAKTILSHATRFADWLANMTNTMPLNPWRPGSAGELIVQSAAADRKFQRSLLKHLRGYQAEPHWVRHTQLDERPKKQSARPKVFDAARLPDLLFEGMAIPRTAARHTRLGIQVRNVLITLLLHGAGLRPSEPFHLFVSDVTEHPLKPGVARIRLFHPSLGQAPKDQRARLTAPGKTFPNRAAYLKHCWGLRPRHRLMGSQRANWKNLLITDPATMSSEVDWFPAKWGRLFFALFQFYIAHCRPNAACRHPYLFVTEEGEQRGQPYTMGAYRQAHGLACEKIGLRVRKNDGTTPHGHRHANGQAMAQAGLDARIIQTALHHRSQESQQVYTLPSVEEVFEAMREGEARLALAGLDSVADVREAQLLQQIEDQQLRQQTALALPARGKRVAA